jgi:hypothetical protein
MFVTPPSLAGTIFVWAKRFGWWQKRDGITNIRACTCVVEICVKWENGQFQTCTDVSEIAYDISRDLSLRQRSSTDWVLLT